MIELVKDKHGNLVIIGKGDPRRGERHHSAKLTAKDIIRIRTFPNNPDTYKRLAVEYNVSRVAISKILNRKSWKHIK